MGYRSVLGAERARFRREGWIPTPLSFAERYGSPPTRNYVLDRRTGELVTITTNTRTWIQPGGVPVTKPPWTPFSTVDPLTGERESGYVVRPPGWEQFIKIDPVLGITPEQKKLRRRRLAEQIARSPTPQVVQGIATIMTTLDDVQDAFVTAAVAGRVVARFFPKLIPPVAFISTIADILNIGSLFPPCHGGAGAIVGRCKLHFEDAGKHTQQTYQKRLDKQVRTGKFRVGWGEIFQILQTTANLVDIGIEIGAGLGYGIDLMAGLIRGADIILPCWVSAPAEALLRIPSALFDPCRDVATEGVLGGPDLLTGQYRFKTIGLLGHLDQAFGLRVGTIDQRIGQGSQWVIDAAKRALQGWPLIGLLSDDLTFEEHLSIMYALHTSQEIMADVMERFELAPAINELYEGGSIRAPLVQNQDTWDAIKAVGGNPGDPRLPVYGAPREMPYREFIAEARADWSRAWRGWLGKAPNNESWWYASQLLNSLFDVQAWALEGPDVSFETAYTREYQAILNLLEIGVEFPKDMPQSVMRERINRLAVKLDPPRKNKLPFAETLALVGISDGGYSAMAGRKIVDPRAT
ncbi:MAG: hypothetical protein WAP47_01175 [Candidatus Rokuibacteriota bacterium]